MRAGREPGRAPVIDGLGLLLDKQVYERKVVGYNVVLFRNETLIGAAREAASQGRDREAGIYEAIEAAICGVLEVGEIDEDNGRCLGAWEVKRVAGPRLAEVLYGIGFGLSPKGLLTPDRNNVSKLAARVWERQAAMGRRKHALDPFSSGTDKACLRYRKKAPHLDFAFEAEGWEKRMVSDLNHAGIRAMSRAKVVLRATDRDVKDAVAEVAWNFWESARPKAENESGLYFVSSNFED